MSHGTTYLFGRCTKGHAFVTSTKGYEPRPGVPLAEYAGKYLSDSRCPICAGHEHASILTVGDVTLEDVAESYTSNGLAAYAIDALPASKLEMLASEYGLDAGTLSAILGKLKS